jgi:undecaprenyl pyrophosphate synthase
MTSVDTSRPSRANLSGTSQHSSAAHAPHSLKHLAIIPDGNRRWARTNGVSLERTYVEGCSKMFELCRQLLVGGTIEEISMFFVSAENLRARPGRELDPLFSAGHHFLDLFYSETAFSHVDLRWVGLHENDFVVDSANYTGLVNRIRELERPRQRVTRRANVLFGYDVRRDIEAAMSLSPQFEYSNLSVHRPVDLIIRSGGQKRLSGFLPLVCQYSEFEFIDKMFPEVEVQDVFECINRFETSARRFGV